MFMGAVLQLPAKMGTVRLWEWQQGVWQFRSLAHGDHVHAIAWSADNRYLASVSRDGTAKVWDAASGQELAYLSHRAEVWAIAFSADSKYVATASSDSLARIWEMARSSPIGEFPHAGSVQAVAFSPDGKYLLTGSRDATAGIWLWQPDDLLHEASQRLTRNLTHEEWQQYMGPEPYRKTFPGGDWRRNVGDYEI
jgi:WD40 repeat protein